jgi:hypothetical protein
MIGNVGKKEKVGKTERVEKTETEKVEKRESFAKTGMKEIGSDEMTENVF